MLRERGVHVRASRVPVRTAAAFAFIGAAACLAACANVWGFEDLNVGDASAGIAASDDASRAGGDGESDDATEADGALADDASVARDARSDGNVGPLRDAGRAGSKNGSDASETDATALTTCKATCSDGCCTAAGKCITTEATNTCGKGGAACVDCTMTQTCLAVAYAPCCDTTSGACGCAAALIVCTPN